MPEETITFELIRKIQREEQGVSKLTKLPDGFYKNINSYLQQKRKVAEGTDKLGSSELKNIEWLVEDIFNRRERKILNMVLIAVRTRIPPENLTEEEKVFFDGLVEVVKSRRKEALAALLEKESAAKAEEAVVEVKIQPDIMPVVFRKEVDEFVGIDMKSYGPFKEGDTAKIPKENAGILIEKGIAEEK